MGREEDAPLLSLFEGHTWSGRKMGAVAGGWGKC